MPMRKAVLIADDNAFVRAALREVFEREPDFTVCAVAENGQEAIEVARLVHPDVIVLDLAMPVMNGLDAARILKQLMPDVPLILYSAIPDLPKPAESLGVSALISKADPVSVLIDKAREVLDDRAA